jgi:hypothetical protein
MMFWYKVIYSAKMMILQSMLVYQGVFFIDKQILP